MRSKGILGTCMALVFLAAACSSDSQQPSGTGGGSGSPSGGASGGTSQSGGAASGGSKASSGGQSASGGASSSQAVGGASASGGTTAGTSVKGGTSATGAGGDSKSGTSGTGGSAGGGERTGLDAGVPDARGSGGRTGTGGSTGGGGTSGGSTAGSSGTGNPDAGPKDTSGPEGGTGGGSGAFDPCPASGGCKILPLGDSITFGVNYEGGYRVKLFTNAVADKKDITYVGKLSNGPASIAGTKFPQNHEGHSGWTIQQIDDIVTGKSSEANYKGKKMMVDLAPNIVLLHAGTNDTSRSPTGMPDRLGTLIDHILEDGPNVLLVVTTIVPIKQGSYGSIGETFNNAVPGVVQKRIDAGKHVILVDMFKSFPSAGLSNDGVHPNQQGYDWMAGVWYDAIKSYLH